ncbi:MAG: sugar phosphate nucleotidyltransferase [Coprobacillaceae bacterium]
MNPKAKAVILAGGDGSRIWPYSVIRNKSMIPISNKPIIAHTVEVLLDLEVTPIIIVADAFVEEIKHYFRLYSQVIVKQIPRVSGSAKTLLEVKDEVQEKFYTFFGDCLVQKEDIMQLIKQETISTSITQTKDNSRNHITVSYDNMQIIAFNGHHRGNDDSRILCAALLSSEVFKYLEVNVGRFLNTKVGVGSPDECFLESSLQDLVNDGTVIKPLETTYQAFDINKPWDILIANQYVNQLLCERIKNSIIDTSVQIDKSARIEGHVIIKRGCVIGKNVWIQGNVIIDEECIIENGAIIGENTCIGKRCKIQNYAKIGANSTVGDDCIIEHCAEFLNGVLMCKTYLYHHGEFYGICGENTDIGAGTVCGTLRFDDGETIHVINGRKEVPVGYANATYLGDYVRTGVNVIFQPGVMVGVSSVVGSGVILNQIVKDRKLIYVNQDLTITDWSEEKYGW